MDDENSVKYGDKKYCFLGSSNTNVLLLPWKQYLMKFIKTWETHPVLWNISIEAYDDKVKK